MQAESQDKESISGGSAVAISSHEVLTNCHVTDGHDLYGIWTQAEWNILQFKNGNKDVDLCVYKPKLMLNPISQVRSYETLQVEEKVYAIGSPEGYENTLSEGIISALRVMDNVKKIQISAPITHGSSGGALFDAQGKLIGITTSGFEGAVNLNFAVSIDEVP